MSKKFTNQYCVHCLNYFEEFTEDHIFPKSWYPDSTPQNMEKWVAPACFECNNRLGKIEDEAYKKLAICINSSDIAASGVSEKAINLYDLSSATNEKDRGRKEANVKKILPDLIYTDEMPKGLMKNFGPTDNISGKSMLVNVSIPNLLNPITEKIVRGLEFKFRNKLIDLNRKITIIHPPENIDNIAPMEIENLNNILKINGIQVDRGPGFVVRHAVDIHGTSLYHITIWGKIEIWVCVSNKDLKVNF